MTEVERKAWLKKEHEKIIDILRLYFDPVQEGDDLRPNQLYLVLDLEMAQDVADIGVTFAYCTIERDSKTDERLVKWFNHDHTSLTGYEFKDACNNVGISGPNVTHVADPCDMAIVIQALFEYEKVRNRR